MFATVRRYDGVDQPLGRVDPQGQRDARPEAGEAPRVRGLLPDRGRERRLQLAQSLQDSRAEQESTKIVATWIRDEKLDTMIPNEPKITSGKVVVHSDRVLVAA